MTLEELKRRRRELGYTYRKLAEESGVPLGTVQKVFGGATSSPRYETLQALEKVLGTEADTDRRNGAGGRYGESVRNRHGGASLVSEAGICRYGLSKSKSGVVGEEVFASLGKQQGEFTVDDLMELWDDQRMELIDGVLYDMSAAASFGHQAILGEIYYQISDFIRRNKGKCRVMIAPFGVRLDRDDRTWVEPDLMIMCRDEDLTNQNYLGAPDFVLEVLSPSTRHRDMGLKLRKYQAAGVREYWMVDVEGERVIVHVFGESPDVRVYRFDVPVPVAIYDGTLEIDLSLMSAELAQIRNEDQPEDIIG